MCHLDFQDAYIKFHEFCKLCLWRMLVTSSSTSFCKHVCHLRFRMVTSSSTRFLQTFSVTYVSGWWHRVPRVLANLVCDVCFRVVTSSSTSFCKPYLWRVFQDGYSKFHEFLLALSVTCVSGWLHRVPRVFASACPSLQEATWKRNWNVSSRSCRRVAHTGICRLSWITYPSVPVQLSLFASVSFSPIRYQLLSLFTNIRLLFIHPGHS